MLTCKLSELCGAVREYLRGSVLLGYGTVFRKKLSVWLAGNILTLPMDWTGNWKQHP